MLDDHERKLLLILFHFSKNHGRAPTLTEKARKTGLPPRRILNTLRQLSDKQFITWESDRHDELKVIHVWEHNWTKPEKQPTKNWWEYN